MIGNTTRMIHHTQPARDADVSDRQRLFTEQEFFAMGEAEIFGYDRVELLDGLVYSLSPPPDGPLHRLTLTTFNRLLTTRFPEPYRVQPQQSTALGLRNVPSPDFIVYRERGDRYDRFVDAADVVLAVEIAYSSLRKDRGMKTRIYATHGIAEYWIVDTAGRAIEVYDRLGGGRYERLRRFESDEAVTGTALPGEAITPSLVIG
jgi:Uma2 family endonuclease